MLAKLDHKRSLLTVSSLCILKPVVQVIIHLNYGLVERAFFRQSQASKREVFERLCHFFSLSP